MNRRKAKREAPSTSKNLRFLLFKFRFLNRRQRRVIIEGLFQLAMVSLKDANRFKIVKDGGGQDARATMVLSQLHDYS